MASVDAVYQNGVFKPLRPVGLPENQHVQLDIRVAPASDVGVWLAEAQRLQATIAAQFGTLPDSTPDIAADRMR
jgi:predicted DNA-binding antitoxin AbrB/MazE fold protein